MTVEKAYKWLKDNSIETSYILSTASVLAWDQRTYLPVNGGGHRAEQIAVMAKLLHERTTNPEIGDKLQAVEQSELCANPLSTEAINVRQWRHHFDRTAKIPKQLAVDIARATTIGEATWQQAKAENDWELFSKSFETILALTKQKAAALGFREEPYDALIDEYEIGEKTVELETLFKDLKKPLITLLKSIEESSVKPSNCILTGQFTTSDQEAFVKHVATALGYDFDSGRLDVTAHPFAIGIGPGDVRITTRYNDTYLGMALFGTIHEAGHAMYEQGLQEAHWGTPLGQIASLGIHESQSRLWENMVGRSRGFWSFILKEAQARFETFKAADLDSVLLEVNRVTTSPIRVEADEVTYNLHILMRFELELALMRNELSVKELPGAWNDKMKEYLGLVPNDLASGVLQDVHWGSGLLGYFPTYTLGNLYAAQMFSAAEKELGDLQGHFEIGDFLILKKWLNKNVHQLGATYKPRDLVTAVTGTPLDSSYFINYCNKKYKQIYNL